MSKASITLGLVIALSTAGAAWAQSPATATSVTGRITSVDSTAATMTVDTGGATSVEPSELKVGDRVRIEPLSSAPDDAPTSTRRPRLGMTGFAVVGIALFLRLRRPRTI